MFVALKVIYFIPPQRCLGQDISITELKIQNKLWQVETVGNYYSAFSYKTVLDVHTVKLPYEVFLVPMDIFQDNLTTNAT